MLLCFVHRLETGLFLLVAREVLVCFCFFVQINFHTKNKSTEHLLFDTAIDNPPPSPKSTMRSPVVTIAQEMMHNKNINTDIGVGYVVKSKCRDM